MLYNNMGCFFRDRPSDHSLVVIDEFLRENGSFCEIFESAKSRGYLNNSTIFIGSKITNEIKFYRIQWSAFCQIIGSHRRFVSNHLNNVSTIGSTHKLKTSIGNIEQHRDSETGQPKLISLNLCTRFQLSIKNHSK